MKISKYIHLFTVICLFLSSCGQKKNERLNSLQKLQSQSSLPKAIGLVNDFENIFNASEKLNLASLIKSIEKETTIEITVVTIDSSMTNNANFNNYTLLIANKWGVGKKDKNNGILIGFSKSLRIIRIQNGIGIEKKISDEQTKEIIDKIIIPQFKLGNYYEGARQAIIALYNLTK